MMVNSIYFETSNLNGTVVKQVLFLNGVYKKISSRKKYLYGLKDAVLLEIIRINLPNHSIQMGQCR